MNTHQYIRSLHIAVALLIGVVLGIEAGNVTLGVGVGLALAIALALTTQAEKIELEMSAASNRRKSHRAVSVNSDSSGVIGARKMAANKMAKRTP
jgi:hypothetical protein